MKVLAIVGTRRKKGTVSSLCETVLEGARENGNEVELLNLYDYRLEYCVGCWACAKKGNCVLQDDFQKIYEKWKEADAVIIGSPCYWGGITAIMKNFFDRHTGPVMYKPEGAPQYQQLPFAQKIKTMLTVSKKFGPHPPLRGKKIAFVTAMTVPHPLSWIWGDLTGTVRTMKTYRKKLEAKNAGNIIYTDTLFRLLPGKAQRMEKKALRIGRRL